jgi:glycosyltransferase involved in cell wall biosynthesis
MLIIAAYTGGINVASARFRVRQHIGPLKEAGISLCEYPSSLGSFPPQNKFLRPAWAIGSLGQRIPSILKSYDADLSLIQREMLSTFVTLERSLKRPRVLDVDDAIWVHMGDRRACRLARLVDGVICGNRHIASYFAQWNSNVGIIPTAVDVTRFHPLEKKGRQQIVIGWSGVSSAFQELARIEQPIATLLGRYPNVLFRVIADRKPDLPNLPSGRWDFIPWSPDVEVLAVQDMDIGVMPLADTAWNRGKCSYKMLLYMACEVPVVVSPVGMNSDVLALGRFGNSAESSTEWIEHLEQLILDPEKRRTLGQSGRKLVCEVFSLQSIAVKLARELLQFVVPTGCRRTWDAQSNQ